jgi:hypothetical protein
MAIALEYALLALSLIEVALIAVAPMTSWPLVITTLPADIVTPFATVNPFLTRKLFGVIWFPIPQIIYLYL